MNIRGKMLTLAFGIIGAFSAITVTAVLQYVSMSKIADEASLLRDAGEKILLLRGDINGMNGEHLGTQLKKIKATKTAYENSFTAMEKFDRLPRLNKDISRALEIISNLQAIFGSVWTDFEQASVLAIGEAERAFNTADIKVDALINSSLIDESLDKELIRKRANELRSAISDADRNLSHAYEVLTDEYSSIDREVKAKEAQTASVVLAVLSLIFVTTIALSYLIALKIGKNISSLEKGINIVQSGNLIHEVRIDSSDEVGNLGDDINRFTRELANSIREIKAISRTNLIIKNELLNSALETTAASNQINQTVKAIQNKIERLDSDVTDSNGELNHVQKRIDRLHGIIRQQSEMVDESVAAVNEMISAIESVTEITNRKKETTGKLFDSAEAGWSQLSETIEKILDIESSVREIRGVAEVIRDISEKTNLLSMNAAIEAAHAGKHGHGFSVVAEEIRKLAEASGSNSKKISKVIKGVVEKIESASISGGVTQDAFDNINKELTGEMASYQELYNCMDELSSGSRQILEAMCNLQDFSIDVYEQSNDMSDSSSMLVGALNNIKEISGDVNDNISEISLGVHEITESMNAMTSLGENLSEIVDKLNQEINRFKTEEEMSFENSTDSNLIENSRDIISEEDKISELQPA